MTFTTMASFTGVSCRIGSDQIKKISARKAKRRKETEIS
jgi:uncharacterized DUF497 family protein